MSSHLTPLKICEALIAPISELGPIFGGGVKYGYHFRRGSNWRDDGDLTVRAMRSVLIYARKKEIPLTADHLIFGASETEIAELASSDAGIKQVAAE